MSNDLSPEAAAMLEEQVRRRTVQLQTALDHIEAINHALRESEARFRLLVSQSMVGIVIIEHGRVTYSNAKFDEVFGYSAAEILAMDPLELADASERERLAGYLAAHAAGAAHTQTTFRGLRRDGADLFVECHGQAVTVEGKVLLMGLVMDVTDRVRAEREVQRLQAQLLEQSTHDPLTGLYNRRFMGEALERALADARQHQQEVSVIMCDVDHFKAINDRVGHLGGDEVLCAVGRVLEASGRRDDVCCRYGGEEFLLVLPTMTVADAHARAEEIRRAVESQLIPFAGSRLAVTASFGVAGFPIAGRSIDEVLIAADRALYAAKRLGRNRVAVAPPAAPRNLPASAHPAHC